ncbi:STAS domain-containing protein [Maledivibacter halophilus]|uniref:Anti-sigma factor antagonist n=1 Tax=Maledivibacter halophilus TaxID=36842 RepID=A0A1T5IVG9_9FIRM|nr:STAS domain-containing protein [Maledivibacter halophilus]SKC42968.1 anti-sigma B factor antagonist [Maledivibacter halophilus]
MIFEKGENSLIVRLEEKVAFENSNNIKEEIKSNITKDIETLVLDMKNITFIDSSGIGILISLLKVMNEKEGHMILKSIPRLVDRILTITKLNDFFQIVD